MDKDKLQQVINIVSRGNTSSVEALFDKPGGRKFLENIVLVLVFNLPYQQEEKEYLFIAFRRALIKIEKRIKHQKQGQKILEEIYN